MATRFCAPWRAHQDFSVRGGLSACCSPTTTSFVLVVDVYGEGMPVIRLGMEAVFEYLGKRLGEGGW